jgi:hypothetical protein
MHSISTTRGLSCKAKPQTSDLDLEALRAVVSRRLALRLGLTLPVASAVASLAGLGPRLGETR